MKNVFTHSSFHGVQLCKAKGCLKLASRINQYELGRFEIPSVPAHAIYGPLWAFFNLKNSPRLSVTALSWKIIHDCGFFDALLLLSWNDEPCRKFRSKSKKFTYCVIFCLLFCLLFLRVTLMARVA